MIFRLAFWQLRNQSGKIRLILFCLALGVSARVAIGSFLTEIRRSLFQEARNLLSADLEISSKAPLSGARRSELSALLPDGSALQEMTHFVTMAASLKGGSRLVEVRAVAPSYPFYGNLEIEGLQGKTRKNVPEKSGEVFVQKEILAPLGLKAGDPLKIGRKEYRVGGVIAKDPGLGGSVFSLGPRALIPLDSVPETGLVQMGSRVYYGVLVRLPDSSQAEAVAAKIKGFWKIHQRDRQRRFSETLGPESEIQVRTAADKQQQIREFFDRLGDYLRLLSFMALLLGGIGVGSVVRGYVHENLLSLAVLRTLGATRARITWIFGLQVLFLGILGSLLGALTGVLMQNLLPPLLSAFIPVPYRGSVDWATLGAGLGLGIIASLFFGLLPVLSARDLKPLEIFRGEYSRKPDDRRPPWIFMVLGALALGAVAVLESRSIEKGLFFAGSFLGSGGILFGLSRFVFPLLIKMRRWIPSFGVRHGIANLSRPGLHPYGASVALGLSAFLLGTLAVYQYSLIKDLDPARKTGSIPNLFLIDVQDDQLPGLRAALLKNGAGKHVLSPMIKARYRGKNGEEEKRVRAFTREAQEEQYFRDREQNLSYREAPGENEELIEGRWMDVAGTAPEASIEEWFAKRLGVGMGDVLNFDVQGVKVDAKVTSVRKVNWSSFVPTFFLYITPGAIEDAPKTWVGSVSGLEAAGRDSLKSDLVKFFPNVTVIDVAQVGQKIIALLEKISAAVKFVALFSIAAGLVVLMGVGLATARQRLRESVLLKILGASPRIIFSSVGSEFGFLSGVSVFLGLALSSGFSWVLLVRFLDISFSYPWMQLVLIWFALVFLSSLTGLLISARVFRAKPLILIREGI